MGEQGDPAPRQRIFRIRERHGEGLGDDDGAPRRRADKET
jgi:hypothetical protein